MGIEDFIRKYISKLKTGDSDINSIIQVLGISLCSAGHIERTPDVDSLMLTILTGYQNNLYSEEEALELLKMISTGDISGLTTKLSTLSTLPTEGILDETVAYGEASYGSYYGFGGGSSSGGKGSDVTVDVESDGLQQVASEYDAIESEIAAIDITIPILISTYAAPIKTDITTGKNKVSKALSELKTSMIEILNITAETDECVKDMDLENISFADIGQVLYERGQGAKPHELKKEEFEKLGYEVDNKGNVYIDIDGKTCRYNLKNHMFYVDKKEAFEVYFYIPEKYISNDKLTGADLKKKYTSGLNTYTFFSNSGYKNLTQEQATDAVLARITKLPSTTKFTKYSETAMATKFINQVAGTDFKSGSRNIIGGDSVYGSHSLQIAAQNKGLYQSVCCVNNAVIVTGENGIQNYKTQFSSMDELKQLDGVDVYFISTSGDENFNRGMKGGANWDNKVSYEDGYTYTGLELICEACPHSKIHMIYNDQHGHEDLAELLKGLEKKHSNYYYEAKVWNQYASPDCETHTAGNIVIQQSTGGPAINYNPNIKA